MHVNNNVCLNRNVTFLLYYTGVVIGFEAAQYIVRKPARNVTVSVVVLFGGLSRDVEVTLATADDSALGEWNTHHMQCHSQHLCSPLLSLWIATVGV